jgi:hypothetical protein
LVEAGKIKHKAIDQIKNQRATAQELAQEADSCQIFNLTKIDK